MTDMVAPDNRSAQCVVWVARYHKRYVGGITYLLCVTSRLYGQPRHNIGGSEIRSLAGH